MLAAELRKDVLEANLDLVERGLVMGTFGNVSGVDRDAGIFVIKASGVPYTSLTPAHMVPVSLETGAPLETEFRPSSDTPTHWELYRSFTGCGGVAHTHSESATALAQSRLPVRCLGTTHADHFRGDVPVTREMTREEVDGPYELNTGVVIVETFVGGGISPDEVSAVLVANHGPFTWGRDAAKAVENSDVLEFLARLECTIRAVAPDVARPADYLIDRHFLRKHGSHAYYGQG
jgi:L-ribulose-5-phosphate 4-epimerase